MVFLGIDVSKGRLDCAVLATEGGRSPGRKWAWQEFCVWAGG
jgi:hypothetical protein